MRESMVESSTGCGELQEAIAALDEAYLTHTGELQLRAEGNPGAAGVTAGRT